MKQEIILNTKDELYRELREKRTNTGQILFRMNAFFVVFVGLKVTNDELIVGDLALLSAVFIILLTSVSSFYLYQGYRAYKEVARAIVKINFDLGLLSDKDSECYFPKQWRDFGQMKFFEAGWLIVPWIFAFATIAIIYT